MNEPRQKKTSANKRMSSHGRQTAGYDVGWRRASLPVLFATDSEHPATTQPAARSTTNLMEAGL